MKLGENTDLIMDVILKRRSGVAFNEVPIPENFLISILEAGRRAPSCANTQAWNFIVLRDSAILARAHEALSKGNAWGKKAPVMILVAAKEDGGSLLLPRLDQGEEFLLVGIAQQPGWFVDDNQLGRVSHSPGNGDHLTLFPR